MPTDTEDGFINAWAPIMAIPIAHPSVVAKIGWLANATGSSKTAAVERAVDRLIRETERVRPQTGPDVAALVAVVFGEPESRALVMNVSMRVPSAANRSPFGLTC